MSVQIRKLHSSGSNFILLQLCCACCMSVQQLLMWWPGLQQHPATVSFHCVFSSCIPHPQLICRMEWKPLNSSALLSHIPPGCQVLHWLAVMMVSITAKGGRGWTGNEWIGFNPSRSLLNTCVAVSHSSVVSPTGSWKNGDFSFPEVIVGLLSNTSFQFQ